MDARREGIHGEAERAAFAALPNFPAADAADICRLVLMQALPALVEENLCQFGEAITRIQLRLGSYFAAAQGGGYASRGVAEVVDFLGRNGAKGLGQSSWGPTGFAFVKSEDEARRLVDLANRVSWEADVTMLICKGNNRGARIEISPEREHARSIEYIET
jgi:beta-RFAP synthase